MKKITIKFCFLFFAVVVVLLGTGIFKTVQSEIKKSTVPKLEPSIRKQLDNLPKSEDIAGHVWYGIHSGIPEVKRFYDKYPYMADYRFNADDMNIKVKTNKQGITKVVTPKNDVLLEGKFDEVKCTDCGIEVSRKNKKGIFSYLGEEIMPIKYDAITCQLPKAQSMERYYIAREKDKYGIFDTHGKLLFPMKRHPILKIQSAGSFFEISDYGKSGIIDASGNIIIKPEYDAVLPKKIGNEGIKYFNVCNTIKPRKIDEKTEDYIKKLSDKLLIGRNTEEYNLSSDERDVFENLREWENPEKEEIIEALRNSRDEREYKELSVKLQKIEEEERQKTEAAMFYFNHISSKNTMCGAVDLTGKVELPVMFKGEVEKIAADYYAVHIDDSNNNYVADKTGKITSKKACSHIYYSYDNTYARCLTGSWENVFRLDGKPIPADSVNYKKTWAWNDDLVEFEVNHKRGVLYKDKILIDPNYAWVKKMGEYFYIVVDSSVYNGSRIIVPIKDLIESKDNINKGKKYTDKEYTYEKIDDNCFKFIKNDDKTEDVYCDSSK